MARDGAKDVLVRNVPLQDLERADKLRELWTEDISRAEALRLAIARGLDVLLEAREWWHHQGMTKLIVASVLALSLAACADEAPTPSHDASSDLLPAPDGTFVWPDGQGYHDFSSGECKPGTCSGCCESSVCKSGTEAAACGFSGIPCKACLQGDVCKQGLCVSGTP